MLSLYETIRMSVTVLNVKILYRKARRYDPITSYGAWLLLLSVEDKIFLKILQRVFSCIAVDDEIG